MPFTIERNDLAKMDVDAVVVAANEWLQITGGVGAAVAKEAGFAEMQAACNAIGGCPTGSAVATPGFRLSAKTVVHAVGPRWIDGRSDEIRLLRSAYDSALRCAHEEGAYSVALPLISAGTYGFPAELSIDVARDAIRDFLDKHEAEVHLVLYDRGALVAGLRSYGNVAAYIDDRYVESHVPLGQNLFPSTVYGSREAARDERRESASANYPSQAQGPRPSEANVARRGRLGFIERIRDALPGAFDTAGEAIEVADEAPAAAPAMAAAPERVELADLLDSLDASFSTTLLALIDARGLTDAQVYKRANMSRQLFSKIRGDESYRPTKKTVLALAIALRLDLGEAEDLLRRAGFALSRSSKADVIVEYYIANGRYDIFEINEMLYAFDQPLL